MKEEKCVNEDFFKDPPEPSPDEDEINEELDIVANEPEDSSDLTSLSLLDLQKKYRPDELRLLKKFAKARGLSIKKSEATREFQVLVQARRQGENPSKS